MGAGSGNRRHFGSDARLLVPQRRHSAERLDDAQAGQHPTADARHQLHLLAGEPLRLAAAGRQMHHRRLGNSHAPG